MRTGMAKILIIAPNYTPATGPSNALYFIKYIDATKFCFLSRAFQLITRT
jgi:hypothetical protein